MVELLLYGLWYWTGYLALKGISFGRIRLAPFATIQEKNRSKRKIDWSPWLHRPMKGRALKAEYTCLVGILIWIVVGLVIYFTNQ